MSGVASGMSDAMRGALAAQLKHRVILASAGSGKTYQLSTHYLRLLAMGAEPGEVLATTFTRKAAGEILGRVLGRLAEAATGDGAAAALGAALCDDDRFALTRGQAQVMLGRLTGALDRVQVSTLDGFFSRVLSAARLDLGLPPAGQTTDEQSALASSLRARAVEAVVDAGEPWVLLDLVRRLCKGDATAGPFRKMVAEVEALAKELPRCVEGAWSRLDAVPALGAEEMAERVARAQAALDAAEPMLPADKRFARALAEHREALAGRQWKALIGKGLAAAVLKGGEPAYCNKPLDAAVVEAMHEVIGLAREALLADVRDRTRATHELLVAFDEEDRRVRAAERVTLFGDLPRLLLEGLWGGEGEADAAREDAWRAVCFKLDARVQHLMLDEFQDTSPPQWDVLRPLAEEVTAGESGGALPRTFFCVGDTKQSIYGWRDGCPEVFDAVRETLGLGEPETLPKSWRSSPVVLGAVDRVFGALPAVAAMPKFKEQAAGIGAWHGRYFEHEAEHAGLTGEVVLWASPRAAEGEGEEGGGGAAVVPADHDTHAADYVQRLVAAHPGASVGVLFRTNKTAARFARLLDERGVALSSEGSAALTRDRAVLLVLSALLFADHPGDAASAYHVLTSPLREAVGVEGVDARANEAVARRVRRRLASEGYASVVTGWARALVPVIDAASADALASLIELAEAYDPVATQRPGDFVRHVRRQRVRGGREAAVRLMTIHGSKGLEFDAVVLPELTKKIGDVGRSQLWRYREHPMDKNLAVYRSVDQKTVDAVEGYNEWSALLAGARRQEIERQVGDDLSALYVAMTRARRALHLLVPAVERTGKGKWSTKGVSDNSVATVLRRALVGGDDDALTAEGELYRAGTAGWSAGGDAGAGEKREAVDALPALSLRASSARSWSVVYPSSLAGGEALTVDDLLGPAAAGWPADGSADGVGAGGEAASGFTSGAAYGTRVHDLLARVSWLDELDDADLDDADLGDAGESEGGVSLAGLLRKPGVRALLTRPGGGGAWSAYREWAFASRAGDRRLMRGVVDRVAVERDEAGRAVRASVVDWKTDKVDAGTIDAAAAHHTPQLLAYRAAVARWLGLDASAVSLALHFVGPDETREVD